MKLSTTYRSLLHLIWGFRRRPLDDQRAKEILAKNKLYSEVTPAYKPKTGRRYEKSY